MIHEVGLVCENTRVGSGLRVEVPGWAEIKLENTREVNGLSGNFGDCGVGREKTRQTQQKPEK
jgi:hypothetical protein